MKKLFTVIFALFVLLPLNANAKKSAPELHESKCLGCHDSEAYTRKDHTVKSLSQLSKRVEICSKNAAKANWSKTQMQSVTEFLNTRYYKF